MGYEVDIVAGDPVAGLRQSHVPSLGDTKEHAWRYWFDARRYAEHCIQRQKVLDLLNMSDY